MLEDAEIQNETVQAIRSMIESNASISLNLTLQTSILSELNLTKASLIFKNLEDETEKEV
jgi:hypothetical protein